MNTMKKLIGTFRSKHDKDKVRKTYNRIRFPELPDALSVINGDGCFNSQTWNYDKQLRLKGTSKNLLFENACGFPRQKNG